MNGKTAKLIRRASPGGRPEYRKNKRLYNKVSRPDRGALKAALL